MGAKILLIIVTAVVVGGSAGAVGIKASERSDINVELDFYSIAVVPPEENRAPDYFLYYLDHVSGDNITKANVNLKITINGASLTREVIYADNILRQGDRVYLDMVHIGDNITVTYEPKNRVLLSRIVES